MERLLILKNFYLNFNKKQLNLNKRAVFYLKK